MWRLSMFLHNSIIAKTNLCYDLAKAKKATDGKKKRLGLFRSPFLVGEAENMWLQPFARTNVFSTKNLCFAFWARVDTKCLNLPHHVLSMDGWPGDATFFLWGQPLKIIRMYSAKKGLAPWNLFLTPAPRPLQVTFFDWWSWTYVVAAFC